MVLGALFDIGIAICPVAGYIYQYHLISTKQSPGTFSIDICGILIFANIMRINFYIFNQYQIALFFQSVFMISVQIMLLKICTKYARKKVNVKIIQNQNNNDQTSTTRQNFWRWSQFSAYVNFLLKFVIIIFSISIFFAFLDFKAYGVVIGLVALLSQSVLILPQIIKNYKKGQVKGLSHLLVVLNLLGDIVKLIYFLIKTQPFQFVLCGIIQVILDSFVIIQIIYYKFRARNKFQKQNRSLIIQPNKNKSGIKKSETEDNIQIQIQKDQNILSPNSNNSYEDVEDMNQITTERESDHYQKYTNAPQDLEHGQSDYAHQEPQTGDRFSNYDQHIRVSIHKQQDTGQKNQNQNAEKCNVQSEGNQKTEQTQQSEWVQAKQQQT